MSSLSIRMDAAPLKSLAFGSFSPGVYIPLADASSVQIFDEKVRILHLQNLTDETILWSLNGSDDHGILISNAFILLDVTTNAPQALGCYFSESTKLYVKNSSAASTAGAVYLSLFYGAE